MEPVRAGADWLALREPADAAARAVDLVERLQPFLPAGRRTVHDLGAGTGSMARWLAPRLGGPQEWVLHDRDAELLAHAVRRSPPRDADGAEVEVRPSRRDITRLEAAELRGAALITASALLDMLTGAELGRLTTACATAGCPVLFTLSVVGRVELSPTDPSDRLVAEAFNAHQRRDTSAGPLLGPDAHAVAVQQLETLGMHVVTRPSPWRLGAGGSGLASAWFTGWVSAAYEQRPDLPPRADGYAARRLAGIAAGRVTVTVHHADLLALPRR